MAGHDAGRPGLARPAINSDALNEFLPNETGRAPCHDGDDHGKSEHVLVGTGEGQEHRADRLQAREQKPAEDGAVDASQPADDGRSETDDTEIKADAEIDF